MVDPSSDGEPLAETSIHVDAIIAMVTPLRQDLEEQRAIALIAKSLSGKETGSFVRVNESLA